MKLYNKRLFTLILSKTHSHLLYFYFKFFLEFLFIIKNQKIKTKNFKIKKENCTFI